MLKSRFLAAASLSLMLVLSGCAFAPQIDASVESFSKWQAPPAATPTNPVRYRFERLPSQQEGKQSEGQAQLESYAKSVLARYGWQEAAANATPAPTHSISLQWRSVAYEEYPWRGIGGFGWGPLGWDHVITRSGQVILLPSRPFHEWSTYQREIAVAVRDLAAQTIVFETRARHDSRSGNEMGLAPLLVDAAFDGFPNPAAGARRVTRVEPLAGAASAPVR